MDYYDLIQYRAEASAWLGMADAVQLSPFDYREAFDVAKALRDSKLADFITGSIPENSVQSFGAVRGDIELSELQAARIKKQFETLRREVIRLLNNEFALNGQDDLIPSPRAVRAIPGRPSFLVGQLATVTEMCCIAGCARPN